MGFRQNLGTGIDIGKENVIWDSEITEVQDAELSWKKGAVVGSGAPLTVDPVIYELMTGTHPAHDINDVHNDW